jgi:hypothetical protein
MVMFSTSNGFCAGHADGVADQAPQPQRLNDVGHRLRAPSPPAPSG